jgi:hypothetical protein
VKISDFNITGDAIPEKVADKILLNHIRPLERVSRVVPFEVRVSAKSGYRPQWYEWSRGRSGKSEHCFKGDGAVDLTCDNWDQNKGLFLVALIEQSRYTRIAEYDYINARGERITFYHCDYRDMGGERWLFDSNWKRIRKL